MTLFFNVIVAEKNVILQYQKSDQFSILRNVDVSAHCCLFPSLLMNSDQNHKDPGISIIVNCCKSSKEKSQRMAVEGCMLYMIYDI